jgi:hypothetical protein
MWSNQEEENTVCNNFQPGKEICDVQQLPTKKRRKMWSRKKANLMMTIFKP